MNASTSSFLKLGLIAVALAGAQIACGDADPSGDLGPAPVVEPGTVAPAATISREPGSGGSTCGSTCYDEEIVCFGKCGSGTTTASKTCFSNCESVAKTCNLDCPIY